MTTQPDYSDKMTEAEYLAFERESEFKHEFADGEIYAMMGASWVHNLICTNVSSSLNTQLRSKDCYVVAGDMRLKVVERGHYRYPDVMVICGEPVLTGDKPESITNPVIVIEVLSSSTALVDHNDKLDEYLAIETVQVYLLIDQTTAKIERYLRQPDGAWLYTKAAGGDATIDLPPIACTLALGDVYSKVRFDQDN